MCSLNELEDVEGARAVWGSLLRLLPRISGQRWMDGWIYKSDEMFLDYGEIKMVKTRNQSVSQRGLKAWFIKG